MKPRTYPWHPDAQLTDAELAAIDGLESRGDGIMWCVVGLPLFCVPFLVFAIDAALDGWLAKKRFAKASTQTLGLELLGGLVVIPVITTIVTIGIGYAFYLWTKSGAAHHRHAGNVFGITLTLALVLQIGWVRVISRHRSGVATIPFEPDVAPNLGIDALRSKKWRLQAPRGGFLAAPSRLAGKRAESPLPRDQALRAPALGEALASIWGRKCDRIQVIVLCLGAVGWILVAAFSNGPWWVFVATPAGVICSVLLAVAMGQQAYWNRLYWARRESELRQKLDRERERDQLLVELRSLRTEIRRLTTQRCRFERLLRLTRIFGNHKEPQTELPVTPSGRREAREGTSATST